MLVGTKRDEPVGTPARTATRRETLKALETVADYLKSDGGWTPTLRWHVNRWLDHLLELNQ